jgi:hypothetical protein
MRFSKFRSHRTGGNVWLIQTISSAAVYNAETQVAPACILWPDHDRQWQAAVPEHNVFWQVYS